MKKNTGSLLLFIIKTAQESETKYPPPWLALKYLEQDKQIVDLIKKDQTVGPKTEEIYQKTYKHIQNTLEDEPAGIIADYRYGFITGITKKAVKRKIESRLNLSDKIDKILTNRIIGPLVMMLILYSIYEFTFWASEVPVAWIEHFFEWLKTGIINGYYNTYTGRKSSLYDRLRCHRRSRRCTRLCSPDHVYVFYHRDP